MDIHLQGEKQDDYFLRKFRFPREISVHFEQRQSGEAVDLRTQITTEPHVVHGGFAFVRWGRDQP